MSSRAIPPVLHPACNASPTSRSFRYRSAQSKCRYPISSASPVIVLVTAGSGISVPKPIAGIWPLPWVSGIFANRKSEESIIEPRHYLASSIATFLHGAVSCDPLDPLATPSRRFEGVREILCLVRDLTIAEFHDAHCECGTSLVDDGVFRDPKAAYPENSFD